MAIKHVIAQGLGFADVGDGVKWIPTHGFGGVVVPVFIPGPGDIIGTSTQGIIRGVSKQGIIRGTSTQGIVRGRTQ